MTRQLSTAELAVYDAVDGPDTVIAYSEEDAGHILIEYLGYADEELPDQWRKLPPDEPLRFWLDDRQGERWTGAAQEAVAKFGRGLLCSTEY